MDRKGIWIIAAAVLLGLVIFGISQAVAQRDFRTVGRPMDGHFPRYQVVNVNEAEIIIMDVTTGDLYSAKAKDVKPYSTRPRGFGGDGESKKDWGDGKDKDRFFKDKEFFKDKK